MRKLIRVDYGPPVGVLKFSRRNVRGIRRLLGVEVDNAASVAGSYTGVCGIGSEDEQTRFERHMVNGAASRYASDTTRSAFQKSFLNDGHPNPASTIL